MANFKIAFDCFQTLWNAIIGELISPKQRSVMLVFAIAGETGFSHRAQSHAAAERPPTPGRPPEYHSF